MEIEKLANIAITDEDILWVEEMMGGKVHFDSARVNVLKNMDSVDIQAFPGSGKTTILVAKLAILAKKWPYSNAGICVLSHTNVAREEIEERLGNTEIGRKLLSYPHFIGTVHSFFDTYVSLPWLKSNGYEINIIDTELVHSLRWNKLPRNNEFTQKGIKHTIFLFEKENAAQVIDEFGQLILDTFSDEELKTYEKEGVHVIGMIHDKKEETKDNQFPK